MRVRGSLASCGATALAAVFKTTTAAGEHAINRIRGRKLGRRVRGVSHRELQKAIKHMGGSFTGVTINKGDRKSVRDFSRELLDTRHCPCIIATGSHYLALRNGRVYDTAHPNGSVPWKLKKWARARVQHVWWIST